MEVVAFVEVEVIELGVPIVTVPEAVIVVKFMPFPEATLVTVPTVGVVQPGNALAPADVRTWPDEPKEERTWKAPVAVVPAQTTP